MNTLYLFIFLVALQVADVATTAYAIRRNVGREANPIMAWLIDDLGLAVALLLPKAIMLFLLYRYVLPGEFAAPILGAFIALYAWVVFCNVMVIRRRNLIDKQ